jgi:predicted RNA methylase
LPEQYGYGHPFNYGDKPVAKYVDIFCDLAKTLPKGLAVTDLFGGVGTLANALQPILEPVNWTAIELDHDCVQEFRKNAPWAEVIWDNAFDTTFFEDLVLIDPHKGTLNAMAKEQTWLRLLSQIATSHAKYILMQEYGAYWCHLPNQVKLYSEMFGERVDKTNYRFHFAHYMKHTYGFKMLDSRMGLGSCYYLMEVR